MAESQVELKLDTARRERLGLEEAIFCSHKSDEQIAGILQQCAEEARSCLLTRLGEDQFSRLPAAFREGLDYDPKSATGIFNGPTPCPSAARLAIVSAGSSDVPVAREALRTLAYHGVNAEVLFDVGVAGLWRLLERIDELKQFPILIVVAGMDAALPTVIGGLYPGLIIAVPTSVGYGVAAGGHNALNTLLSSCSPGIAVVNIDNGYGAACTALRALRIAG